MSGVWRRHVWRNRAQAALLVGAMLVLSGLLGETLIGAEGVWITLIAAVLALAFEPASSRMMLRRYCAEPITETAAPNLWQMLRTLAQRAGLPAPPTLHYVPSSAANAFSVSSRSGAAIALSDGLLRRLSPRELTGVIAHELAHIARGDLRVMSLAEYLSRLTHLLSILGTIVLLVSLPMLVIGSVMINWQAVLLLVAAPHLMLLAQLGLSRVREFDADLVAVAITRDPQGLASALVRIDETGAGLRAALFRGFGKPRFPWLRTHPATAERVRRLLQLGVVDRRLESRPVSRPCRRRAAAS
jgi:heat shock protein HtpX